MKGYVHIQEAYQGSVILLQGEGRVRLHRRERYGRVGLCLMLGNV